MKYFITPNTASKHGYDFIIEDENGERTTIELTRITSDGYIHLPQEYHEVLNRKLLKFTDFEGKGEYEITRREGRSINRSTTVGVTTSTKAPKKNIEEWLTEEEKAIYNDLIAKAMRRAKKAQLEAQIEELKAQLAEAQA